MINLNPTESLVLRFAELLPDYNNLPPFDSAALFTRDLLDTNTGLYLDKYAPQDTARYMLRTILDEDIIGEVKFWNEQVDLWFLKSNVIRTNFGSILNQIVFETVPILGSASLNVIENRQTDRILCRYHLKDDGEILRINFIN